MNKALLICLLMLALGAAAAGQASPAAPAAPRAPKPPEPMMYTPGSSYLGVDISDITPERSAALQLKETRGVEVTMVDQDAPAGKAGLKEHDVIVSFNGETLESVEQMRRLIRETPPGRTVTLGLVRAGQPLTLNAQVGKRRMAGMGPDHEIHIPPIHIPEMDIPSIAVLQYSRRNGVVVENLTPQLADFFGARNGQGVLVRSVEKGSAGEAAGLKAGDVIVRVGNETVSESGDWSRLMRTRGGKVPVVVIRDRREQTLTLNLPERAPDDSSSLDWDKLDQQFADLEPKLERAQEALQRSLEKQQQEVQKLQEQMKHSLHEQ